MRKNIVLTFVILFLFGAVSFVNAQTISADAITNASFDFEDNLLGWEPNYLNVGSDFNITSDYANTGESSACLKGFTRYHYLFANESSIAFTNNVTVSFSWMFTNYDGYYIGVIIYTSDCGIFLTSHFSGIYANSSSIMVIQYDNEALNTWYTHTVNVSDLLLDYYGSLPEYLTSVQVINRGYGTSSDPAPCVLVTYFDSIHISTGLDNSTDPTITITSPGYRILTTLGVLSVFVIVFTRKTKKN